MIHSGMQYRYTKVLLIDDERKTGDYLYISCDHDMGRGDTPNIFEEEEEAWNDVQLLFVLKPT